MRRAGIALAVVLAVIIGGYLNGGIGGGYINQALGFGQPYNGPVNGPLTPGSPLRSRLITPPRDAWWLGGRGCPVERHVGWARLPSRSGCVTRGSFDINGDGRLDRILLYGHLSNRRAGQGFIPTSFTLEVLLAGGGRFKAQIAHPQANVTMISAGNVNDLPGDEIFLAENRFRPHAFFLAHEPQLVLVYSLDGHKLIHAGSFRWAGDATRKYGVTCHEHPPTAIVQHEFLRQGRTWRRVDTTWSWFGATLRRTATTTSKQQPSHDLTIVDCRYA
jgi:hypothetical protein